MPPRPIEDVSGNNQEVVLTPQHPTTRNRINAALVDTVAALFTQGVINGASMAVLDPVDPYSNEPVPFLPDIRQILRNATGTDNLASITEVKLRVVTRDVSIRHLSIHTPNLRELTLDGSAISTLRDLGCGMNSLKVLKINGCKLKSLDGLNGVRSVEKLYAANNELTDLLPCTCLEFLRHLDVRNNMLDDWNAISFLALCEKLKDLVLDENNALSNDLRYRQEVKSLVPQLKCLDNVDYYEDDNVEISDQNASDKCGPSPFSNSTLPNLDHNLLSADLRANTSSFLSFDPKTVPFTREANTEDLQSDDSDGSVKLPKI